LSAMTWNVRGGRADEDSCWVGIEYEKVRRVGVGWMGCGLAQAGQE
jgi:hypothetical protein